MKFAKYTFLISGIYGLFALVPLYFLEEKIGLDNPPPITHPEFFYGFIGVAIVFQLVYLLISTNPLQYRAMMILSALAKFSFGIPVYLLYASGRIDPIMFGAATIDLLQGILFAVSYFKTKANN